MERNLAEPGKQMLTYTSAVLAFLAFMVALVAGADLN